MPGLQPDFRLNQAAAKGYWGKSTSTTHHPASLMRLFWLDVRLISLTYGSSRIFRIEKVFSNQVVPRASHHAHLVYRSLSSGWSRRGLIPITAGNPT